jgi:hypothetical protein
MMGYENSACEEEEEMKDDHFVEILCLKKGARQAGQAHCTLHHFITSIVQFPNWSFGHHGGSSSVHFGSQHEEGDDMMDWIG